LGSGTAFTFATLFHSSVLFFRFSASSLIWHFNISPKKAVMMRKAITLMMLVLITLGAKAQQAIPQPALQKEKFHFGRTQDDEAGYAQAVRVGNTIYVSGTVSSTIDSAGITRLYSNIERSLAHFGATMQHVVKENLYTTDMVTMKANNEYRKRFYKGDFPAATWVQISRLYMEDLKLEVEVTAILPASQ
jgi:enamine deaminase RidA (YjgF/YER057c/UK114 family)